MHFPPQRSVQTNSRRVQQGHRILFRPLVVLLGLLVLGTWVVFTSVLADSQIERLLQREPGNQRPVSFARNTATNFVGSDRKEEFAGKPFLYLSFLLGSQKNNYDFLPQGQNNLQREIDSEATQGGGSGQDRRSGNSLDRRPREERLIKADSFNGDLRNLPYRRPVKRERPEREGPEPEPRFFPGPAESVVATPDMASSAIPTLSAPAPPPSASFDGLDFANWGAGHPPDTNGDVGPIYFIQTVNTSIGIYRKSDGVRVAAFTFDTFMSQGNFGNVCDTDNFGDPIVLYDSFEDRWIISDFAFKLSGGNVLNPPGAFQCIAASKTGDPVSGGWNFYSINTTGGLGDYPKLGIWPDGLYMSVNMFDYAAAGSYQNPRVYAFNKSQMYAGAPTVQSVSFNAPASDFTLLPSNARLQTGTPPPGTPNYFVSTWEFLNALTVYKFHVDWERISLSTFTGPDTPIAATSWPNASVGDAPSQGGNDLDVLEIRAMMQNQYSNIGGTESLWNTHTVRRGNTSGFAAPRWYQVDVTGGTVAANIPQAATWDPDGANVIYRFMPSLAVDRIGDMALGYSTSSSTTKPALKYAGRLATDPINTFSQTEQVLIQGAGTQTGSCGGSPCTRWGDYSAMSLDPNGCTFWYTNEYYAVDGLNDLTRIGSFAFPQCAPVVAVGTVSGTVTDSVTTLPINGAKITLGSRTTTTNALGNYSFTNLPPGTYPVITASSDGYGTGTFTSIVVMGGATKTQNFSLVPAPLSACFVDTSQADFQTGVASNVDFNTSPGDVVLLASANVDQQNLTVTTNGFGFTSTGWAGQTFTAGVSGILSRVDLDLFCSGCTGTTPDLTVSIRATAGNPAVPTGADLAVATIPGFSSGSGGYFSANFATPTTLTAGTRYAVIIRASSNPSAGTYAYVCSCTSNSNPYANGQRVTSTNSGSSWTADNVAGGRDLGFIAYVKTGFASSGDLTSGAKDANPPNGVVPHWTTLSWNAATPANTAIKFQGAGSSNINGPFNFVGPDGTAATFFTNSGASLAQFDGLRYLKYKAFLSTTLNTVTPTLNDVTICTSSGAPTITAAGPLLRQQGASSISQIATVSDPFQPANTLNVSATPVTGAGVTVTNINVDASGNVTASVAANCAATNSTFTLTVTNNSAASATATLTVNVSPSAIPTITPSGATTFCQGSSVTLTSSSASGNQWYLNGNPIGGATGQQFVANLSGSYAVAVTALSCTTQSLPTVVTVNPVPPTPTITPGGPTTFCAGGSVTLTSSSASGNQWYLNGNPIGGATNQQYVATASGSYTTIVTSGGCSSSPSTATVVTVNPVPPTPTVTPSGATTFCEGGSVTLTSSSASGNQWYLNGNPIGGATGQQYVANASGSYTTIVTSAGCSSSPSVATVVTVNSVPPTPTITPGGPTTFCAGGSVTLTSSSASGNQWYLNGNPIGGATNQQYVATASGSYTTIVTSGGCSSSPSLATVVTVNPAPPTPTVTPSGATTFCEGGSVTLTSSSASGNQWYLNGNPIGGATNQQYVATASGSYTTVVTSGGCSSSPSTATVVTVNPTPGTPTVTPSGATTFCEGGSVTLTSSSASGNQWYLNGNPIGGATNQQYVATASGSYTTVVTSGGCSSSPSTPTVVTVNPIPPTPTVTPGGATTFCEGGSVTLTSSSTSGNQWYLNGNPIGGATNQQYVATASGSYTTVVTTGGCSSSPSTATVVTVNPAPSTPTVAQSGPTTFCEGGSVTLTSSSASGNQWYLNGNPIGGATNQQYVATASGSYTTIVTSGGCSSSPSLATVVTVNPIPATPTITPNGPTTFVQGGSVTLTSSSVSGNQWYLDGAPIGGATNQQYVATASGSYTVTVTTNGCASTTSTAIVVTVNPLPASPTITKAFNPTTIPLNSTSTLSFTISNPNTTTGLSGVGFSDSFPAGLVVAASPNVTGSCGSGVITATPGSTNVSLSGGTLAASPAPGSACTFSVAVTGTTAGTKLNTTSAVTSTEAGTGATSNTASLTVVAPPALAKSFNLTTIAPGGLSTLTITISNPGSNTVPLTGVGFTDNFPTNLVVGNPSGLVNSCGGTATAVAGSGSVSLTGGTIPINSFCTVSVTVTSSVDGLYLNNINSVSSTNGGTGNSASANLRVITPPSISKLFLPNVVVQDGTTTLSLTISNPNVNTSLSGLAFTDNLPAGLSIASPNNLTNSCGGTMTAVAGTASISLVGGTLGPASNPSLATCVISLKVKAPNTTGTFNNTTGPISAAESGAGATSNTASLQVIATPAAPTIAKSFGTATIPLNGKTSLTFTLANPNSALALSNVSASDTLPAGLVVATPNNLSGTCSGSITANAGSNSISITGLNLVASGSCSLSVNVTGTSVGTKNNVTGNVSATYVVGGGSPIPISGGTASASLNVSKLDQTITFGALVSKVFGDPNFIVSATASSGLPVSFLASGNCTATSPSPGTVHITGAGSCTIIASQSGDSTHNAAPNVSQSFSVAKATTTTTVVSSINPSDLGQTVVFTATVTPAPNTPAPTGMVQFKDGVTNIGSPVNCSVVTNTCRAQFSTNTLTTGTHAISAVYNGNTNFSSSVGLLSVDQVVTNLPGLQLIVEEFGPYPNLAASLDSLLFLRDPFPVQSLGTWYGFPDQNTRVMIFVANLQLNQGESSSVVVVHLTGSNNQVFDIPAEDVRPEPITGFAQITFRLPDALAVGDCNVLVKAHGQFSNTAIIRISP